MALFDVYVEGATDPSPQALQRLAEVMAQRYGLPAGDLANRLAKGRFRVKANVDEATAQTYVSDLEAVGARVALVESRGDVKRGMEVVEFALGVPSLMMGEVLENVARGIDCEAIRQPLGVCAGITPFNFPAMVPLWMYPIAIACGNTFVLKPSEKVPLTAIKIAKLLEKAGLLVKRRSGREQLASGDVAAVRSVASMLTELEQVWRGRIARIDELIASDSTKEG